MIPCVPRSGLLGHPCLRTQAAINAEAACCTGRARLEAKSLHTQCTRNFLSRVRSLCNQLMNGPGASSAAQLLIHKGGSGSQPIIHNYLLLRTFSMHTKRGADRANRRQSPVFQHCHPQRRRFFPHQRNLRSGPCPPGARTALSGGHSFKPHANCFEPVGTTRFREIGKTIQPERGKLLAWNNRVPDRRPNPATIYHEGV